MLIQDRLQAQIQFAPLAQQFVEFGFTQNAAQRGLGELRGGVQVIGDFNHRQPRIDDAEENHRVHLHRHVVSRDHILAGHFQRLDAQRHAHHAVNRGEDQHDARSFGFRQDTAQPEHYAPFVLPEDLDGRQQVENENHRCDNPNVEHVKPPRLNMAPLLSHESLQCRFVLSRFAH